VLRLDHSSSKRRRNHFCLVIQKSSCLSLTAMIGDHLVFAHWQAHLVPWLEKACTQIHSKAAESPGDDRFRERSSSLSRIAATIDAPPFVQSPYLHSPTHNLSRRFSTKTRSRPSGISNFNVHNVWCPGPLLRVSAAGLIQQGRLPQSRHALKGVP